MYVCMNTTLFMHIKYECTQNDAIVTLATGGKQRCVSELEPFTEDLVQSSLTLTGVVVPGSNCYPRGFHTKVGT